jgi:hypothetical protein
MSATTEPGADASRGFDPEQFTVTYTQNEDGWVTAQVDQFPAAISQGPTRRDALVNVLEALHDLTHRPTLAEQLAFTLQARVFDPITEAARSLRDPAERAARALRDLIDSGTAVR